MRWRPFELNPDMPREGMDREEYRRRKFGDPRRIEEMDRRLVDVGAQEGIAFALSRITRTPNTLDAHRLIFLAQERDCQDAVVESLFQAFFCQGRDLGDRETLADIASGAGLERAAAREFLEGPGAIEEIRAQERGATQGGIDSVPFFILGGKFGVAGAQAPELFLEAFKTLAESSPRP